MSKRSAPSPSEEKGNGKASRDESSTDHSIGESELKRIMSEAMTAQLPKIILEASKVVSEQIEAERGESSRSFSSFSHEMKMMKQRQEEIAIQSKAASFKSDGKKKKSRIFLAFLTSVHHQILILTVNSALNELGYNDIPPF